MKTLKGDMRELKNIYQNVNKKHKHYSAKSFRIENHLKEMNTKVQQLHETNKELEPAGEINKLKTKQLYLS